MIQIIGTIERLLCCYAIAGFLEHALSMPGQRRRQPRLQVSKMARLHFGNQSMLARILDLSSGGARLRCATSEWLPTIIEVEDAVGQRYRASLVWRGEEEIGVRWIEQGPELAAGPTFGRRGRNTSRDR
jgi:hypothetical protein